MNAGFAARCRQVATINASIVLSLSAIAAVSGVLLAVYYQPAAGAAYVSLKAIARSVTGGSWILALHDVAGNGLILAALLQVVLMFLSRQSNRTWYWVWLSTIGLLLVGMALSWTAIVLDWTQEGYWRFAIELRTIAAIPVVGNGLRDLLVGGPAVSTATLTRMYALHSYVLAIAGLGAAIAHLVGMYRMRYQALLEALSEDEASASYVMMES
ncbi:MAG: cytochrome b N-terminal domain-containing protein [Cyanobacteria bacterium P01_E01_bin.48]